jgi:hypothetical protein
LGIEGVDKLVDKHFHKVPDKYIDPHTYNLRARRRRRHAEVSDGEDSLGDEEVVRDARRGEERGLGDGEENIGYDERPRESYYSQRRPNEEPEMSYTRGGYGQAVAASHLDYSEKPRYSQDSHQRPRAAPAEDPDGSYPRGYYAQDALPPILSAGAGFEEYRESPRRRREGLVRRSSSQPGTKRNEDRERERRRRRRSLSGERKKETAGGQSTGTKTEKVVLTLLGAAVGGLAVSAVMGSMENRSHGRQDIRSNRRARTSHGGRGGGHESRSVKGGGGRR